MIARTLKLTLLAAVAAVSLGTALAPTTASAYGWHWGGGHWGGYHWGGYHRWGYGGHWGYHPWRWGYWHRYAWGSPRYYGYRVYSGCPVGYHHNYAGYCVPNL